MMVWFFELFPWILLCSASTLCSSSNRASHTFAGASSHNLSTIAPTYVFIITSTRAGCCRGSTSSVRVQRVGCTCNSNEVGKSPVLRAAMRCAADALRRCSGDVTEQTAMQPRRNRCSKCSRWHRNRFKIKAGFRQNTDKIQTAYMQIQACMYVLVSITKMQTTYRLNTNTILFQ